jgi:hypothetical protein
MGVQALALIKNTDANTLTPDGEVHMVIGCSSTLILRPEHSLSWSESTLSTGNGKSKSPASASNYREGMRSGLINTSLELVIFMDSGWRDAG